MAEVPIPEAKAWMIKAWRDLETARRAAIVRDDNVQMKKQGLVDAAYR